MANRLGIELGGKTVIFPESIFHAEYKHLAGIPFKVDNIAGNGRFATGLGGKLYGIFANGQYDVMRGEQVQALVEDDPTLDQMLVLYNEAEQECKREEPVEGEPGTVRIIYAGPREIGNAFCAKLEEAGILDADCNFLKGPCAPDAPKPKVIDHKKLVHA